VYHQPVQFFVQAVNAVNKAFFKFRAEKRRIQYKERILLQKVYRKRNGICKRSGIYKVAFCGFNLINGEKTHPFLALRAVRGDFGIHRFLHAVERDAVIRFDHEFLFQVQLFLEVLDLREEGDDLPRDFADDLCLRQVFLCFGFILLVDVIEENNVVLDIKIKLAAQELTQILMDEVGKGVAGGITVELALKQRFAVCCRQNG
jgi:hypothetical protein